MTRTEFARTQPGQTVYAQKRPKPDALSWEGEALAMPPDPNDPGSYILGGADYLESYECYIQAGAKPEPTDLAFWEFVGPRGAVSDTTGTGSLKLTVECRDTEGRGVARVGVDVLGTQYGGDTDSNGFIDFNLDSGPYTLRITPPGGFEVPDDVVVDLQNDTTEVIILQGQSTGGDGPGWVG